MDGITHVINFEIPNEAESYVHRIGRTARAGAAGIALSFCNLEEVAYLADIEKLTGIRLEEVHDHPHRSHTIASRRDSGAPAPAKKSRGSKGGGGAGGGSARGPRRPSGSGRPKSNGNGGNGRGPRRKPRSDDNGSRSQSPAAPVAHFGRRPRAA